MDPAGRHHHISLRLPVRSETVRVGRRAAAQFAEEVGCGDETLWKVRVAVSEAITNVVLHAHPQPPAEGEPVPHLVLAAEAGVGSCTISISDDGIGLQARSDSPGLGLGLGLIARSCEELSFDAGSDGGTTVRMRFLT
jgi:serine/threonine-protein kinase RsbW